MRDYSIKAQEIKKNLSDYIWTKPSSFWPGGGETEVHAD